MFDGIHTFAAGLVIGLVLLFIAALYFVATPKARREPGVTLVLCVVAVIGALFTLIFGGVLWLS